jgi:hypothetical protein
MRDGRELVDTGVVEGALRALFARVQPVEERALPVDQWLLATNRIAAGRLDLDDARTHVGEHAPHIRASHAGAELQHDNITQRAHARLLVGGILPPSLRRI